MMTHFCLLNLHQMFIFPSRAKITHSLGKCLLVALPKKDTFHVNLFYPTTFKRANFVSLGFLYKFILSLFIMLSVTIDQSGPGFPRPSPLFWSILYTVSHPPLRLSTGSSSYHNILKTARVTSLSIKRSLFKNNS
jgi:hypothetical protein